MLLDNWSKTTTIEEVAELMVSSVKTFDTLVWTKFNEIHLEIDPEIPEKLRKQTVLNQYKTEAERTEFDDR